MRFTSFLAAALPAFMSMSVVLAGTTPEEVVADLVDLSTRSNDIGVFAKLVTNENAEDMSDRILTAIERLKKAIQFGHSRLQASDPYEAGADADHVMQQYHRFAEKTMFATQQLAVAHDELVDHNEGAIGTALDGVYGSLLMYNRDLYCLIHKAVTEDVVRAQTGIELAIASAAETYNHTPEALATRPKKTTATSRSRREQVRRIQLAVEI